MIKRIIGAQHCNRYFLPFVFCFLGSGREIDISMYMCETECKTFDRNDGL